MAIGSNRYSHYNAQKHETIRQNIGRDIRCVVPKPNYWGTCPPSPGFGACTTTEVHTKARLSAPVADLGGTGVGHGPPSPTLKNSPSCLE